MNTRNVLKDGDAIAMCAVAMVDVRGDRVADPRTAVARDAGAPSPGTETTMPRQHRRATADKPAAVAGR